MNSELIVAVGMFDGVHRGHQFVLERLRDIGRATGLTPAVVTFADHPLALIRPDRVPGRLTTLEQKVDLIRSYGIDNIHILDFDETLRRLSARDFAAQVLVPQLSAHAVVLGYDNTFGSDRLEGVEAYRAALAPLGIDVYDCPRREGADISSTLVRKAVADGRLDEAANMLGRPYAIGGRVTHGKELGRTIGFPTANIDTGTRLLPPPGVYAARVSAASHPDIIGMAAMLNIGHAPTANVAHHPLTVEAHIITDAATQSGDAKASDATQLDLYGTELELELVARIRDEKRFADLDALRDALAADRLTTLRLVGPSRR